MFGPSIKLRVHFRVYSEKDDSYKQFATYGKTGTSVRSIAYDSLIKKAFEAKKPMIGSLNKKCNPLNSEWDDFITVVPIFTNSIYTKRVNKTTITRPIFSFGISFDNVKAPRDMQMIYLLSHFQLDQLVSDVIEDYVDFYKLDPSKFLEQLNEPS